MNYVIIGNSAAGIGAVEGIRQVDKDGAITVITDEPHHTYSRPLISYLLYGKVDEAKMKYRPDGFYSGNKCEILHCKAEKIDADNKQVVLSDGKNLPYDKLLVAAGSSAFTPPFDGLDSVSDKFTFMCLDDAKRLGNALGSGKDKRVLIIGAGLIGLKCAEGILEKSAKITVADLAPRILPAVLDETGAEIIQKHLESKGIEFRLSAAVKKFDGNTAVLESGEEIAFDILVTAAGVRPNTALLKDIAEIGKGIVVNAKSETSRADIYAAGDCTEYADVISGQRKIMALLPNAYIQGEAAGINMAGGCKSFDKAIPMNAAGFFGLHIITAGGYEGEEYVRKNDNCYKRLFFSDNRLNGYILVGDTEKAGIYTSLIRERTPLDSIDFALVCEKPGLMAFSGEDRKLKLGGVSQ